MIHKILITKFILDRFSGDRSFEQAGEKSLRVLAFAWSVLAEAHLASHQRIEENIHQVEEMFSTMPQGAASIPTAWSLYQTFILLGDPAKASTYLEKAYREVNDRSNKITDRNLRTSYFTNVRENREIVQAWEDQQKRRK